LVKGSAAAEASPARHLLLGGGGFIGRHMALLLSQLGHHVTIASRHSILDNFSLDGTNNITWKQLELGAADWDSLIDGMDIIHHYAWGSIPASANANPRGDLLTNVTATIDLLDALRRRKSGRLLFASSGGTVYGKTQDYPVPETHILAPITAYGAGKVTAEVYLNLYRATYGVDCRIARIANPFGAGQDLSKGLGAVTTFIHRALTGQRITLWGDGEVIRDYIHISDAVRALAMLSLAPLPLAESTFNIGSGRGTSLNQILEEIETQLGRRIDVERTPGRTFDVPINVLSIARAQSVLGWSPALSFSHGMAMTFEDLRRGAAFSTLQ
jgi:UDP-glucose 4-epimerase